MSKLWIKQPENVSQSDLRRIQEEKAARQPRPEIEPPSQSEPHSTSEPGINKAPAPEQNVPGSNSEPHPKTERTKGFLLLTNHFLYDLMPSLKPTDAVVLLYLIARTHGFRETRVTATLDSIATACHISRSQARVTVNTLDRRRLIKVAGRDTDNPNPLKRGIIIDMLVPRPNTEPGSESRPRSKYVPHSKYKPIKDRGYKREESKEVPPPSVEDLEEYERARRELEGK